MEVSRNQKGSTLVISIMMLTCAIGVSGHIITQILQREERYQIVAKTNGMHEIGIQAAHLFIDRQQEEDINIIINQLPQILLEQNKEVIYVMAHARKYLSEADTYYISTELYNLCAIQSYQYTIGQSKTNFIENTIYVNDSKGNLTTTDYNFKKANRTALKLMTDYDIVQDKYQRLLKKIEEGLLINTIDTDFIDLQEQMNKRYQFLLYTYVYQSVPEILNTVKMEQAIISLLSYTPNNSNQLTYDTVNVYALNNTGGSI